MLTSWDARRTCGGWTRRQVLQAGGAGLLGLSLPKLLAAEAAAGLGAAAAGQERDLSVPVRRAEPARNVRSQARRARARSADRFKPIALAHAASCGSASTCRGWPRSRTSYCVIRTMTHPYNDHSSAGHYIQTGRPWHVPIGGGFNATEKDWPTYGSVVDYLDDAPRRRRGPRHARASSTCPTGWAICRPTRRSSTGPANTPAGWAAATIRWPRRSASATTRTIRTTAIAPTRSSISASRVWRSTRGCRSIGWPARRSLVEQFDAGPPRSSIAAAPRRPTTSFASGRWRWSARRKCARRSTFARSRPRCAIATAGTCSASRRWSPGGWSKPARASSPWPGTRPTATAGIRTRHSNDVKNHLLPGFDQALVGPARSTWTSAACSTRRWSWPPAKWGARPRPTTAGAAAIGARCSPAVLAGAGVRGGMRLWQQRSRCGLRARPSHQPRRSGRHDLRAAGHRPAPADRRPAGPPRAAGRRRRGDSRDSRLKQRLRRNDPPHAPGAATKRLVSNGLSRGSHAPEILLGALYLGCSRG